MSEPVDPTRRLLGAVAMVAGVLIALASAGGMLVVAGGFLYALIFRPQTMHVILSAVMGGALLVVIFGLTPTVGGILLARWGRRMMQPPQLDEDAPEAP